MDAWSALLILASSFSPAGVFASFAGQLVWRVIREREILEKGIQRSLSDLSTDLLRLEETAAQTGAEGRAAIEEIDRLAGMKADLLEREKELKNIPQQDWNRVRDETLQCLDLTRGYLRKRGAGRAPRPV